MAYIRFDQDPMMMMGGGMFTADGRIASDYAPVTDYPQPFIGSMFQDPFQPLQSFQAQPQPQQSQVPQQYHESGQKTVQRKLPNIRNMKELYRLIGSPDVIDKKHGGIAIWSGDTLKKAGYGFIRRLEIIDESVPSVKPVKHFSNLYIWVHMKPTIDQLTNILSLSKDIFYDRKKELLIVRSDNLDTAVAQAALVLLYVKNKVSFYDMISKDLLMNYYTGVLPGRPKHQKVKKALYTILNTTKKMK